MITIKQLKNGAKLPNPIYVSKPYVMLGDNGKGIVLNAGTIEELLEDAYGTYYDDAVVEVRTRDLHMNDNTKIADGYGVRMFTGEFAMQMLGI
jgi:hypothetical protein